MAKEIRILKRYENEYGANFYAYKEDVFYCDHCGKILTRGMTDDDGNIHVHEDCFNDYMNQTYGEGNWKETETDEYGCSIEDDLGGYYLIRYNRNEEWEATGIYYTEWDGNWDVDFDYSSKYPDIIYKVKRTGLYSDDYIDYIKLYVRTDKYGQRIYKYIFNPVEKELDTIEWEMERS